MSGQTFTFGNGMTITIPERDDALRTDIWLPFADGEYRFWLPIPQVRELEAKCSRGILGIYGSTAAGRYQLDGVAVGSPTEGVASDIECRETVRLALIGGGAALVDGAEVKVDAATAARLVENYLTPAPFEEAWRLAFIILDTAVHGRKQRPNEVGTDSRTTVYPVPGEAQPESEAAHAAAETNG